MNAYQYLEQNPVSNELTKAEFFGLVRFFRNAYLQEKDFYDQLLSYRNPDQLLNEIQRDLNDDCTLIQGRPEMRFHDKVEKSDGPINGAIARVWEKNKRFTSIYEAVESLAQKSNILLTAMPVHLAEYCAKTILYKRMNVELSRRQQQKQQKVMIKHYQLEQRTAGENQYVKVFLKSHADFRGIASILGQLPSVRTANVTEQRVSGKTDLTVYPAKAYAIEETIQEVSVALDTYFKGSPSDPVLLPSALSAISDKAYFQIMDHMLVVGKNMESVRALGQKFDEETYRDYFLPSLNALSPDYSTKGEVFNRGGRTDILVSDKDGNNIFIAECKLWKGEQYTNDAIDQLFDRYVNWRDEKLAIVIFNKENRKFTDVIEKAIQTVEKHPLCVGASRHRKDTSYSFTFKNKDDDRKTVKLELILFDFS